MFKAGTLRPRRLVFFMCRLTKEARCKVFLILDSLNMHRAKVVREWLEANRLRIEVFCLPPYTPECNPSVYFSGEPKEQILGDARRKHDPSARV